MINDFKDLFIPFDLTAIDFSGFNNKKDLLINNVKFFNGQLQGSEIETYDIAIIGIPEDRNSVSNKGSSKAPDCIRNELYKLYKTGKARIIDLGNLITGKTIKDTYSIVSDILLELFKNEIAVVVLGGSNDLLIPVATAYRNGNKTFTLCSIEPRFLMDDDDVFGAETYLSEIINNNKKMFHFINLGYQSYYNSPENIKKISDRYEALRLGLSSEDITINEPMIRDSDIVSISIESIRLCDAPATGKPSINGYYGEDICQLSRYAGISEKVSTFSLFNLVPELDTNRQTASLAAQIVWYFFNGFSERKNEYPLLRSKKFQKFIVNVDGINDGITFYKSPKTQRWWVEINYVVNNDERSRLISCTKEDYQKAARNEIPERWWKFYQKFNKFKT